MTFTFPAETAQVIEWVFGSMLGLEVTPAEDVDLRCPNMLTGTVFFTGAWQGALLFECLSQDACLFASKLMKIPQPEAVDDDVRDCTGELANMIGGNLKVLLPKGCMLSVPSVIDGMQYSVRVSSVREATRYSYRHSEGGLFNVCLMELNQP